MSDYELVRKVADAIARYELDTDGYGPSVSRVWHGAARVAIAAVRAYDQEHNA